MSKTELYNHISENLDEGDAGQVKGLVAEALSLGAPPADILQRGLLNGMTEVGRLFKARDFYIPEVVIDLWEYVAADKFIEEALTHKP